MSDIVCKLVLHLDDPQDKAIYDILARKTPSERKQILIASILEHQKTTDFITSFWRQGEATLARAVNNGFYSASNQLSNSISAINKSINKLSSDMKDTLSNLQITTATTSNEYTSESVTPVEIPESTAISGTDLPDEIPEDSFEEILTSNSSAPLPNPLADLMKSFEI